MSEVIEHLAELTGFRDRDVLDVTLVGAFRDLLQPESVAIFRPVGEAGAQRWLTRARLLLHETTPRADSMWSALEELPELQAFPAHHRCLSQRASLSIETDGSWMCLFALTTDRDDVNGVLEICTRSALDEQQVRMVSSILRVYRNFQGLLDYSERDTLTGLLNRKTFDGSFLRVAARGEDGTETDGGSAAGRRGQPAGNAWLGVVDIDHFKSVNDTHGHLIGDEVLLLAARLMRNSFRFQDQLYRFGGEEFVVLMRGGNAEQAVMAFERMRTNVQNYAFPRVGTITVSVGFSQLRSGDTPSGAFERADKAVYYAKQHGRNQVAHYGELIERGVLVEEARISDVELF